MSAHGGTNGVRTERLELLDRDYRVISPDVLKEIIGAAASTLPVSLKVLFETVTVAAARGFISRDSLAGLGDYDPKRPGEAQIPFSPGRVLLQDFTGVPALVDLAAMRSAMSRAGRDPSRINPRVPVDLVIDHSVQVDFHGAPDALARNVALEYERNSERYSFIKWGQRAFSGFTVVPPGNGICHQVNLERLASVVTDVPYDGERLAHMDTLVGTDSHTPMVGGLGVLGWGVGGIEAEAAMLGQPLYMGAPQVIGVELTGALPPGATATDLVLTITAMLREHGVVGKFVEYFGDALPSLSVPDRATISNMAPEYGATVGFFPVDERTLDYMADTGRPDERIELTRAYCEMAGVFGAQAQRDAVYTERLRVDLSSVEASVSGPSRPQDRIVLGRVKAGFNDRLLGTANGGGLLPKDASEDSDYPVQVGPAEIKLRHGAVAIAAITSCTNTSNPSVMIAAGLLAKKALERGLRPKAWVKTSLAPGSTTVTEYLEKAGLLAPLAALGFDVAGYGCTTCIGNSGPISPALADAADRGLVLAGVLSGNRNFEGRIHPNVRANYLASPPLVVAYAIAGSVDHDLTTEPLGIDRDGMPVLLADLWPSEEEIAQLLPVARSPEMYRRRYDRMFEGDERWRALPAPEGLVYDWPKDSTYIQEPPFFAAAIQDPADPADIRGARALLLLGDSVTTDHISPAGAIAPGGPAATFLEEQGVEKADLNSFGSRRGNDRVMTRGTFANIRIKNRLVPGTEGGVTRHLPSGERMSVFEAAERYRAEGVDTVVLAGLDYGMGSSRDWAAKGTRLLGVRAVIARSFERIHRSNLVGMGVLPLQLEDDRSVESLGLTGEERFDIDLSGKLTPGGPVTVRATAEDGRATELRTICRLDNSMELDYLRSGGILTMVLKDLIDEG